MGLCYCTGKCRELGYCPNDVVPVAPPGLPWKWKPQPTRPPTVTPFPAPQGWICPKCGASNAPWSYTCGGCRPPITITLSNSTDSHTYGPGWPD